jgi:50S ribosomal protein L16 3-hydroxylase
MSKAPDPATPRILAPDALLGGHSPAQFMRQHWQKRPLLVRQALPGLQPLVTRGELLALAARDDVESRLITCTDSRWTLRHGPIPRRVVPPFRQPGWTLLVQGLDLHVDAAHALLSRFRFLPEARLDDLMLSYASDGGGVGPHTDAYDVFLLQVQGQRRWRVGRCPRPQWRDDVPLKMLTTFDPVHDWVLQAGDMLYLPPGWAHEGVALGGDCMTASIGFRAPNVGELAQALLPLLAEGLDATGPRFRDAGAPPTATSGAIPTALSDFAKQSLRQVLADDVAIERALGQWITEPKPRVWFEPEPDRVRRGSARGVRLDKKSRVSYDAHDFYLNGESFVVRGRDARVLQALADQRELPAEALRQLSGSTNDAVQDWVAQGWAHWTQSLPAPTQKGSAT